MRKGKTIISLFTLPLLMASFFAIATSPKESNANSAEVIYPGGGTTSIMPAKDSMIEVESETIDFKVGKYEDFIKTNSVNVKADYKLVDVGEARTASFGFPFVSTLDDVLSNTNAPTIKHNDETVKTETIILNPYYLDRGEFQYLDFYEMLDEYNASQASRIDNDKTLYEYKISVNRSKNSTNFTYADLEIALKFIDTAPYDVFIFGENGCPNYFHDEKKFTKYVDPSTTSVSFSFYSTSEVEIDKVTYSWNERINNVYRTVYENGVFVLEKLKETTFDSILNSLSMLNGISADSIGDILLFSYWRNHYANISNITLGGSDVIAMYLYDLDLLGNNNRFSMSVEYELETKVITSYDPYVYGVSYALTPAKYWKSFNELTINVEISDAYVVNTNMEFEKTDFGYTYKITSPSFNQNLFFGICESENPAARGYYAINIALNVIVGLFGGIASFIAPPTAIFIARGLFTSGLIGPAIVSVVAACLNILICAGIATLLILLGKKRFK